MQSFMPIARFTSLFFRVLGVFERRRAEVLSKRLAEVVPRDAHVLDVGSGDGRIAWLLGQQRPDLRIEGVDVPGSPRHGNSRNRLRRPAVSFRRSQLRCRSVRRRIAPRRGPVRSAARGDSRRPASGRYQGPRAGLARSHLGLLDWFGNFGYGVALPYNYWRWDQWQRAFCNLGVEVEQVLHKVQYWGWPGNWLIDGSLNFIVRLGVGDRGRQANAGNSPIAS